MLAAAGLLASFATSAFAAPDQSPANAKTDVASSADGFAGIVVTAQRRSEPLQNVPDSVGVLSGNDLADCAAGGPTRCCRCLA
jgi:outer membrane receptor protein involved in Fe transport